MPKNQQTTTIINHIKTEYGTEPEFLWPERYHMNKNNWITILLDGTLPDNLIFNLIKKNYLLSD